jgi:N-ethylmaleimide reductase
MTTPNSASLLLSKAQLGKLTLKNRVVMAPLTRSRATADHIPTDLMVTYYAQRASAGLIITEGTSPSKNGVGYARIPGLYNDAQIEGWRKVTDAVHSRDGRIFVQLMHTGRISHVANLGAGAEVIAPSAIKAAGEMFTDAFGMKEFPTPREMTAFEIEEAIEEYVQAAQNAIKAGFDGVELHAANGYLIEQFIRPTTNHRKDAYGGSIEGRAKFLLKIAVRAGEAIGFDRLGVRISPYGVFNDMPVYPEMTEDYLYIARELSRLGIVYLHVLDHSSVGAPPVPEEFKIALRETFRGSIISAGGYDDQTGEKDLRDGKAQFIAYGRPFISNPDLADRFRDGKALSPPDFATFYTPGEKGYIDYPKVS